MKPIIKTSFMESINDNENFHKALNDLLLKIQEDGNEIIDIKFSTCCSNANDYDTGDIFYNALIIYKNENCDCKNEEKKFHYCNATK